MPKTELSWRLLAVLGNVQDLIRSPKIDHKITEYYYMCELKLSNCVKQFD